MPLQEAIERSRLGEFIRYEVDVLGANHQITTIDFSLRPLKDESEQVVLLIPEGRDISDVYDQLRLRKRAEQALKERERKFRHLFNSAFNLLAY